MKRIESYSNENKANLSEVDRKVLRLLYTAVFGKVSSMRSSHKTLGPFIIFCTDILGFLESTKYDIDKIDESGRVSFINSQREKYINEISQKIQEAKYFIENDVHTEIQSIFEKLGVELQKTVKETIALQAKTIKEIQKKAEYALNLKKTSFLKKLVGVIGDIVKVASNVMSMANGIGDFIKGAASGQVPVLSIGEIISSGLKELFDGKIDGLEKVLIKLKGIFNGKFKGIVDKVEDYLTRVLAIKTDPSQPKIAGILKDVISFVDNPLQGIPNATEEMKEEVLGSFKNASNVLSVITTSMSIFKELSSDDEYEEKMQTIGQAINEDRETLKKLMDFEDRIHDELIPMLNRI